MRILRKVVATPGVYECMVPDAVNASRSMAAGLFGTNEVTLRRLGPISSNTPVKKGDVIELYGYEEYRGPRAAHFHIKAVKNQQYTIFDTLTTWCLK